MSSDRLEDVVQRLDELEATVRGLTLELVEANERIRELETQVTERQETSANKPMPSEDKGTVSDDSDGDEVDEEWEDDIIVA